MKKTGWRNGIRRAAALSVSVVLALSVTAGAAAGQPYAQAQAETGVRSTAGERNKALASFIGTQTPVKLDARGANHSLRSQTGFQAGAQKIKYTDRPYEHFDPSVMESAMEEFEKACLMSGGEEEVARLYDLIISEFDRLATSSYMAQIEYDRNVSDEAAAGEQAYTTDMYSEMADKAAVCLQKGLSSSYKTLLEDKMGEEYAAGLSLYQEYSDEELELRRQEQELLRQYDQLVSGDISVTLEDGEWTYSRLETDTTIDTDRYSEIGEALAKEKNHLLGANFMDLVKVRKDIAEEAGYDNYVEYAYEAVYGRDYTMEDAERLSACVRSEIVPLNELIWNVDVDSDSYEALDALEDSTTEEILDTVSAHIGRVDSELGSIFNYMEEMGLYDIQAAEGVERADNSYTVGMPSYADAFIFISRTNTYRDYQALIHEFGHFSSYYYNTVPELFQGFSVDICEFQSQGLELLASDYASDMFGGGGEAYAYETVTDMLFTAITACMLHDFEKAVYTEKDMSLEEMNRRFKDIQDSYSAWYYRTYGDTCYDWVDVPHLYYSPLYYMGYGTSALSALDLWTYAQEDREGAKELYMGILKEGLDAPYRDTISRWGLRDVFEEEQMLDLTADVRRIYGLDNMGYELDPTEEIPVESTGLSQRQAETQAVIMIGVVTVIILQAMGLCVGFVVIWLHVKGKEES